MGYLRLLLLNNLEVILNVFKLFTSSEIFVSYFIYNLNHFKKNSNSVVMITVVMVILLSW